MHLNRITEIGMLIFAECGERHLVDILNVDTRNLLGLLRYQVHNIVV